MNFTSPDVSAVFALYEQRDVAERARVAAMPPGAGFDIRDELLLPVGPDVGWFLHSLVLARRPRRVLELGTSYGYSTLFLADAVRRTGGTLVSMEIADYKQGYAQEMIARAGLADAVDFRLGDALEMIAADTGTFDFVLLDIWKELYVPCFEAFYPKLGDEGIVAADNMIEPAMARPEVRAYRAAVRARQDMHTTLLPIGSGIEISARWPEGSAKL